MHACESVIPSIMALNPFSLFVVERENRFIIVLGLTNDSEAFLSFILSLTLIKGRDEAFFPLSFLLQSSPELTNLSHCGFVARGKGHVGKCQKIQCSLRILGGEISLVMP